MRCFFIVSLCWSLLLNFSWAQEDRLTAQQPTTLDAVIDSTIAAFPKLLEAQADIRNKQALSLATEGAFDPHLSGTINSQLTGFYGGESFDAGVYQQLPFMNMQVFAGYRISEGTFPVYNSNALTQDRGELRAGIAISLLRDRDIDERRAARSNAQLALMQEMQSFNSEQIAILQNAYISYARWLLAWRLHQSYQELLDLAVTRGQAIDRSVTAGDEAEILLIENQQAIVQREGLLVDARRQVDMAAEQLSLYFRDNVGNPIYPLYADSLSLPEEKADYFSTPIEQLVSQLLERRPEIAQARLAQDQAEIKLQLADNLAKPKFDFRLYSSKDFGDGPLNLVGNDSVADLSFSVPLRTREAKGKASAAREEMIGLEHRIRYLSNQLENQLRQALVNLDATRQMEVYAIEEQEISKVLAEAEEDRFSAGLSNFFLLNVRERQMGEAQLKRWQAHLTHQVALANFYAASMNVEALGY